MGSNGEFVAAAAFGLVIGAGVGFGNEVHDAREARQDAMAARTCMSVNLSNSSDGQVGKDIIDCLENGWGGRSINSDSVVRGFNANSSIEWLNGYVERKEYRSEHIEVDHILLGGLIGVTVMSWIAGADDRAAKRKLEDEEWEAEQAKGKVPHKQRQEPQFFDPYA